MYPKAVLMMAYGGPDSLDDVEPYLLDVRGGRATPLELVAEIKSRYAAIGGKSPLLELTRAQAQALEERLNQLSPQQPYKVYVGMRHWSPYIREAVRQMKQDGIQQLTALCMTPYSSRMSTQAYFEKLDRALDEELPGAQLAALQVTRVHSWYSHPLFTQAAAEKVKQAARRFPQALAEGGKVIFTAHSLPAAVVESGDPYQEQLLETVQTVAGLANLDQRQWQFCFQSAGASAARWLGPSLEETLDRCAEQGIRQVLIVPIGFISDHVEILFDVDIEAAAHAQTLGMHLERTETLNCDDHLINALAQIVLDGGDQ